MPKKTDKTRIAELEKQVADLDAKLQDAIRRIPNVNLPVGGLRPICHAHLRLC